MRSLVKTAEARTSRFMSKLMEVDAARAALAGLKHDTYYL